MQEVLVFTPSSKFSREDLTGLSLDELVKLKDDVDEAADKVSFMSMEEVQNRIQSKQPDILLLDVREQQAFEQGHLPGAILIPRGQLELRVNEGLPDPTRRILVYCELGKISTLAAATLRELGFGRAIALDGGIRTWREAGYSLETGK